MNRIFVLLLTAITALPAMAGPKRDNELALIDLWLDAQRAHDRVPGLSAAIVHDQDLLWSNAYGHADVERARPAGTDTIYGICSISKLFTGIAVMQLRDQGKLRLDDPVTQLLPWFNLAQAHEDSPAITLRGILTHSAGLPRESDTPYWTGPDFAFPDSAQIRKSLAGQQTLYPAGRYYQYSNLGLTLAGDIVAEISGQGYERYVRERILLPLGLQDTNTGFPEDDREARIATGYSFPDRGGEIRALPRYDARGITPAAGFSSTALDLVRFAAWQFRARKGGAVEVLAGNTLREMQRVHWVDWDWEAYWGLAFGIYRSGERTLTGHGGSCPGFNTRLFLDPEKLYGVAVMANRNNVDVFGYARVILDILDAEGTSDAAVNEALPQAAGLEDYTGGYSVQPWGGEYLVFRWKDELAVTWAPEMDPLKYLYELKRVEGDRFRLVRRDGQPGHEFVFQRDEAGQVNAMRVHSNVWLKR
jgi:CubicO group peptidase (beta-lactamase class C family)